MRCVVDPLLEGVERGGSSILDQTPGLGADRCLACDGDMIDFYRILQGLSPRRRASHVSMSGQKLR